MILIDPRDGGKKLKSNEEGFSTSAVRYLRSLGVFAEKCLLDSADLCFEGNGPDGTITIGIERKSLHDMLACIEDGRYNDQRRKMKKAYGVSILMVEGLWRAHEDGWLMQGWPNSNGVSWGYCRPRGRPILFSVLYNYLLSVAHSGVTVTYPADSYQLCCQVKAAYHYYQKRWKDHTAMLDMKTIALPTLELNGPSLVRKWAADIDAIGTKRSMQAERLFKKPIKLATADEMAWLGIDGISPAMATRIVRQIHGIGG